MFRRGDNTLKKVVSISEDCCGTRYKENENELSQNENKIEILKSDGSGQTEESLDSEKEIFIVAGKGCISHPILSPRITQTLSDNSKIWMQSVICAKIVIDGTIWKKLEVDGFSGPWTTNNSRNI
ncbi:hypothetical protein K0M31_007064 [Melipona bicolor]|uniref:Uncharacterized protein n=1 Tax=Melipona bicolor TaxID=60889 RepID=A0AA40FRX7_9HYME|nr:hypothetical protein K0M31_007064 [Melipona bicolor]